MSACKYSLLGIFLLSAVFAQQFSKLYTEGLPTGVTSPTPSDIQFQDFRIALRERLELEHYSLTNGEMLKTSTIAACRHIPGRLPVTFVEDTLEALSNFAQSAYDGSFLFDRSGTSLYMSLDQGLVAISPSSLPSRVEELEEIAFMSLTGTSWKMSNTLTLRVPFGPVQTNFDGSNWTIRRGIYAVKYGFGIFNAPTGAACKYWLKLDEEIWDSGGVTNLSGSYSSIWFEVPYDYYLSTSTMANLALWIRFANGVKPWGTSLVGKTYFKGVKVR